MVTMADGDFVAFKDPKTGIVARYPEHYGDLFPDLIPVDESQVICVPCRIAPDEEVDDEDFEPEWVIPVSEEDEDEN